MPAELEVILVPLRLTLLPVAFFFVSTLAMMKDILIRSSLRHQYPYPSLALDPNPLRSLIQYP